MSSAANNPRRSHPGRPRHVPALDDNPSGREEILDASARLFVDHGFAATSTRMIAEQVGIRQASIYYHFAGKEDILAELLERSIRPTTDKVAQIEGLCPPETPATALCLLLMVDVRTLVEAPHNIGYLGTLPEVTRSAAYEPYVKIRRSLTDAYERLGSQVAGPDQDLAGLGMLGGALLNAAEVVIAMRRDGDRVDGAVQAGIADSGLRMCGASQGQIDAASKQAKRHVDAL